MTHEVFISYSHSDAEAARTICEMLEEAGIGCWIAPRNIPPGAEYGDLIDRAIGKCKVFLVVYSAASAASQWVRGELNLAFSDNKALLPVRLDSTPLVGAIRLMLNQVHWFDAQGGSVPRLCGLTEVVRSMIGSDTDVASSVLETHPPAAAGHSRRRRLYLVGFCCAALLVLLGGVYLLRSRMAGRSDAPEQVEVTFDALLSKAEAGDPVSQYRIGKIYMDDSARKDMKEAVRWFLRAAEQGLPEAQYAMGVIRFFGDEGYIDLSEGAVWYRKAAEQGLPEAQFSLGHCYATGKGVEQNISAAREWYDKAARQGHPNAVKALERLSKD